MDDPIFNYLELLQKKPRDLGGEHGEKVLGGTTWKSLSFVSTFRLPQQFVDGLCVTKIVRYVKEKKIIL